MKSILSRWIPVGVLAVLGTAIFVVTATSQQDRVSLRVGSIRNFGPDLQTIAGRLPPAEKHRAGP